MAAVKLSTAEQIAVADITWDANIYPREKHSASTVTTYVEAMRGGAVFPPVVLEKETLRLLDGKHRWLAAKEIGEQTILAQIAELNGLPAKTYSAALNISHGDRLPNSERREVAREQAEAELAAGIKTDVSELARMLGVSERTAYEWVGDIIKRRDLSENAKIGWLSLMGWTQREVAECVFGDEKQKSTVQGRLADFCEIAKSGQAHLSAGKSVEDAADATMLPPNLVQALALEGKDDAARLSALKIGLQPYDVWNFSSCHPMMGHPWPGRVPGEIVCHLLYFYTSPGDTVVDPMAGSGTTIDACVYMGRKVYACDANPDESRYDIIPRDFSADGWHPRTAGAALIFWDPPYYNKMDDGYSDASISRFGKAEYLDFFRKAASSVPDGFKGRLAFLCSDYNDEDNPEENIFFWDYVRIFADAGWTPERRIQVPLTTQQVHPDIVNKFRAQRRLARLGRDIAVFQHS